MAIDPLEPVIIQMNVPEAPGGPFKRFKQSKFVQALGATRTTKIITALSAIVISVTMVATAVFIMLANNKDFQKKRGLDILPKAPAQVSGGNDSARATPGGNIATGVGGTTGTNSPEVTITADPASVKLGGTSQLKWSVTNNPTSCTASDDWSGTKSASGSEATPKLTKAQTYLFTITCKTATGTGFATVPVGTLVQTSAGTGSVATRPSVTLAANPTAIYVGDSSTLTWTATNNPTSCTAGGDWSGTKSASGPESTGTLSSARTYTFKLKCSNAGGESPEMSTTVKVTDPPPGLPVVTLSANPIGPITPGSSSTLSWTSTNNPTSCTASGDWSGTKAKIGSASTGALNTIKTYSYKLSCANSAGSLYDEASILVLPNKPVVSLTVNPSSLLVGSSANISWTVSNTTAATSCTGSEDWPGTTNVTPVSGGTRSTGVLSTAKTYYYGLRCVNEAGDGYVYHVPLNVTLPPAPVVSISASPISVTGTAAAPYPTTTISWSVTNNPTSCTPSDDLAAPITPLSAGSKNSGSLIYATKSSYKFSLQCSNAGGISNLASTTVSVSAPGGGGQTSAPVVTISTSPASISTGSSSTVSWSATNTPTSCTPSGTTSNWVTSPGASGSTSTGNISTAGTRTYTITCSNSAGSGSKSATLTVVALPTVTVTLGSNAINTGASTTYSWNSSNASSCTGGGALSGSMAASGGPITTGVKSTAGTYNYTVTCVNSVGGSASATAVLTVSNAAPVYCAGKTPCYGISDLASHATAGNCWGWNLDWVINITSFRPHHPGAGNGTIENASSTCNHDIHAVLIGNASIPGYTSGGSSKHNHQSSTNNNSGSSQLAGYRTGYYDSTKP